MWTIQEVTLAQMNRVFFYGGHEQDQRLQWLTLSTATDALKAMKYPFGHIEKAIKSQRHFALFLMAQKHPLAQDLLEKKPGDVMTRPLLWSLLLDARLKKSSDPKDKIFALFGVFSELKI
jgi:hypothetical protein